MNFKCTQLLLKCAIFTKNYSRRSSKIIALSVIRHVINLPRNSCTRRYSNSSSSNNFLKYEIEHESMAESPYIINDYDAVINGDPQKLKLLKRCQLELDLMLQEGTDVPSRLKPHQWYDLISIESKVKRFEYLKSLRLLEMQNINRKKFLECRKNVYLKIKSEKKHVEVTTRGPIIYNLEHNTIFHRIRNARMTTFSNLKLMQAMMFAPKIIIDMGFEENMTARGNTKCAKQLFAAWFNNREYFNPSYLHFHNVKEKGILMSKLNKVVPNLYDADFPFVYTTKSYLDMYPKEKLVYLTPDCKTDLNGFDPDTIYIIGAVVDNEEIEPKSLTKAKKDGLRTAKFPLRKYINWSPKSRTLTISQCISLLNDLKDGANWKHACKYAVSGENKIKEHTNLELTTNQWISLSAKSALQTLNQHSVYDMLLVKK